MVAELDRLSSPLTRHPSPATANMDSILFHPETSVRRALIQALGTYGADTFSPADREPQIPKLLDLYRNDPDAGIHGSAEWVLRQWKQDDTLEAADAELSQLKEKDRGNRRWYLNSQGQTFVLVEGPVEFQMGSPDHEPERFDYETLHEQQIPRQFAIATKEVTVEQYQIFLKENPAIERLSVDKYSPDPRGPRNGPNWYDAAAFCNWLSRKEKLPECYKRNERGQYDRGMTIPADALRRKGYRLPTEAEWEYACRAGATSSRYYGNSIGLLEAYARYHANSRDHAWRGGSLLPNDLGLFDMLGNVYEWCQERYSDKPVGTESPNDDIIGDSPRLLRGGSFSPRPADVRSANRYRGAPTYRSIGFGFRLARTYN